jgi:hypothetical protein
MFIGIDLGTSSIKSILVGEDGRLIASASESLHVSRPAPGFSEQDPESWWTATIASLDALARQVPREMAAVRGIGLSGQMHGATLLDKAGAVLRPCILWNDVRSAQECRELEQRLPDLGRITGNPAMPGFTAPKLMWVKKHEPDIFARIDKVLLPKAYLRYRLGGTFCEDMSDAAGTLWLDVGKRAWSDAALAATDLTRDHMPALVEGTAPAGQLSADLTKRWGRQCRRRGGAGCDPGRRRVRLARHLRRAVGDDSRLCAQSEGCGPCVLPLRSEHLAPDGCHSLRCVVSVLALERRRRRGRRAAEGTGRCAGTAKPRAVPALSLRRAHAAQRWRYSWRLCRAGS